MKNTALVIAVCAFLLFVGIFLVQARNPIEKAAENQTATTSLTAQTPVASTTTAAATTSVSATHPAPTPTPAPVPQTKSGIRGSVTIGPTCPVERDPPDPACADKPYQTTLVVSSTIVGRNGGILVQTDAQGHFMKELTPGTYTIRSTSNGTPPTLAPVTVTVTAGKWTQTDLVFDSGIR